MGTIITNILLFLILAHMRGWNNRVDALVNKVFRKVNGIRLSVKKKLRRIRGKK